MPIYLNLDKCGKSKTNETNEGGDGVTWTETLYNVDVLWVQKKGTATPCSATGQTYYAVVPENKILDDSFKETPSIMTPSNQERLKGDIQLQGMWTNNPDFRSLLWVQGFNVAYPFEYVEDMGTHISTRDGTPYTLAKYKSTNKQQKSALFGAEIIVRLYEQPPVLTYVSTVKVKKGTKHFTITVSGTAAGNLAWTRTFQEDSPTDLILGKWEAFVKSKIGRRWHSHWKFKYIYEGRDTPIHDQVLRNYTILALHQDPDGKSERGGCPARVICP